MLKYIFSILLIGAVWAVVLLLEFPMWIAIVSTAVIVAILLTIVLVKLIRAKKAAKDIEKALQAQAAAHAASARPDLRAEVDAMQNEFLKAVSALKSSKLSGGKRGAEALYALPWYMIIGPPGAGKSTALRNSGLRFPYSAGAVAGVGGTRNCQWWMTNDAVILDTAGRYTTEDADRDEWMSFLDLLKKNRPKRPVNGVLAAIALTELSDASPDHILARAREIRARIDETMAKLEMVIPVYILFTKCDLIPGFVEMYNDLGAKERSQIWGFTIGVTSKGQPAAQFNEHFDELALLSERRSVRRLAQERGLEARDKIYAFGQHFEPMRENLSMFVGELMADSIYTETPIFRGAYFTSGTQEGRPIDKIMNAMAEAFGVQPQMSFTQPQVEAKSYFLGDVFSKVIFADKNVATRSASRMRRQAMVGHLIAAGLFLTAIGLSVLPVLSFSKNRDFLTESDEALVALREHKDSEHAGVDPIAIDNLTPLYRVERELDDHEADGIPLLMRMGMYQGGLFADRVEDLYVKTVREEVVAPLFELEVQQLKRFVQKYGPISDQATAEEHEEFRNRLRMYLLLSGPWPEKGEPGLDETQSPWLGQQIGQRWADRLEKMNLTGDVSLMKRVGEAYVDNLSEAPENLLFERDTKLVTQVRKVLKRTDRTDALLAEVLRHVETADLDLRSLTDSNVALKNDSRLIKGSYTRQAWETEVRDQLETALDTSSGDEWVLGRTEEEAAESRDTQLEALRSLYFENYIKEWKGFIGAIYVDPPGNLVTARRTFEDLTKGATPPFKRLCQFVDYHTTLVEKPSPVDDAAVDGALEKGTDLLEKKGGKKGKLAGAGIDALKKRGANKPKNPLIKTPEDVREAFAGLSGFGFSAPPPTPEGAPPLPAPAVPLDQYQEELKRVRDALQAKIDHDDADATKALESAVKTARTTVDGILNESDLKGWRSTFTKWLPPPFEAVYGMVRKSGAGAQASQYCENIYKPMTEDFLPKYPFSKQGRSVKLKEFAKALRPETGTIWTFYATGLASRVPRKHGTYEVAKRGAADSKYNINPKLVGFLERAQDLSDSMFPTGSEDILVEFDVYISDNPAASLTTLQIDGTTVEHYNGPGRWQRLKWPGDGTTGSELKTRSKTVRGNIKKEGDWGFFELLEEGTVTGSAEADVFVVKWDLRDQEAGVVTVKFRPTEENTPFFGTRRRGVNFLELFRHADLAPPANLFVDIGGCAK